MQSCVHLGTVINFSGLYHHYDYTVIIKPQTCPVFKKIWSFYFEKLKFWYTSHLPDIRLSVNTVLQKTTQKGNYPPANWWVLFWMRHFRCRRPSPAWRRCERLSGWKLDSGQKTGGKVNDEHEAPVKSGPTVLPWRRQNFRKKQKSQCKSVFLQSDRT